MSSRDNETWVIDEGDRVIRKKAGVGFDGLTTWERLVYCLWVADYAIRNGGDLESAKDFFCDFQSIGTAAAANLSLPLTREIFAMDLDTLEREYLDRFEEICAEVRSARGDT